MSAQTNQTAADATGATAATTTATTAAAATVDTASLQTELAKLAVDAQADYELVKKAIPLIKAKDWSGLASLGTQNAAVLEAQYKDVKAALPDIKTGYQTTEFWLVVGVVALNAGYTAVTGKALPVDSNVVLGGVVAIYTAVRGLVKSKSSTVAASAS
jgi:hypothetical protein